MDVILQIPKNQQIIDFILAQHISAELETMDSHGCLESSVVEPIYKPFLDDCFSNLPASVRDLNCMPNLQFSTLVSKSSFHPSFEGSSTGSNLPKNYQLLSMGSGVASCTASPEKSSGRYPGNLNSRKMKDESCGFGRAKLATESDNLKGRKKTEIETYHSKNLITERNRRHRINHGLLTLRSLVPNISKVLLLIFFNQRLNLTLFTWSDVFSHLRWIKLQHLGMHMITYSNCRRI